ncbi:glutamate receptor 3.7 [Alnus glutinosa]|uniref:glutamate receptor 3.7 n=1 Tax=Alnus glutinosa TaxID=3517 RepID=UPI002D79C1BB|nr:glutamate receptor 3.7 [Alnus glutinosa]
MKQFVVLPLTILIWVFLTGSVYCQSPAVVNIGAVFTFNSVIGRVARVAMEAAVSDVNADPRILNETKLNLIQKEANCSAFLGSIGAFQVLEKGVVAIIGPQSSAIARMISEIANGLEVPLISYAATDPTLSALQFPFFLRTAQSDSYQMAAMADLIDFYEWKEVIAIFVDDDYGRNGISALDDELDKKKLKIAYRLALPIQFDLNNITDILNKSKSLSPRVYVVHVDPDPKLRIFTIAQKLQMMTSDFVWLATDWLSATLDSLSPMNQTSLHIVQGVVALRQHTLESSRKRDFVSRWRKMLENGLASSELNTYGLIAYDTVWAVARSIDEFVKEHRNITFSFNDKLLKMKSAEFQLGTLKAFDGGSLLLKKLLQTNFTGLSGKIQFNQDDQNIVNGGYDVINIDQMAVHTVGYWTNASGFSVLPPENLKREQNSYSRPDQKLNSVTWPGGKKDRPRGWMIATNERPLRIGVPNRASFVEFATEQPNSHTMHGYCIDVFVEALKLVPYYVPYRFEPFGNGSSNPSYDGLVQMVADEVFYAAVGDIAIVTNRTKLVDFSQPYATTGLVIVAPVRDSKSSAWVFLQPFTVEMWCATGASFVMIAVVIWILEHRVNNDFRGPPKRQIITMFLFSFSTLFKTNQESTVSPLGRMVMVVWLFLLMVITASYTASLTSILTVQQLSSPITGIDSLISSNWPIGYQVGSFAYSYLADGLYIPRSRLKSLGSPEEYERALRQGPDNGGVAAIIDELTYVELFLSKQTEFGIIGQPFTKSGWGFAFKRGSPLAVDISTAVLKLAENGSLQKIHERWFCKMGCPGENRHKDEPNRLHMISFWGLYLLCGIVTLGSLLVFFLRMVRQFLRYKRQQRESESSLQSPVSSEVHCSQVIYSFFDFIDEKEEAIKKIFTQRDNPQGQNS